jgi:hypothetical protein
MAAAERAGYRHALGAHAGLNRRSTPGYAHSRLVLQPQRSFSEIIVICVGSQLAPIRLRRPPPR